MSSVIHSNAANFQSFLQNGVDPRTGQYTLAIALPALAGNDLIGPQLPLRLTFNPLNDQDSGFGKGWELSLTQYVPGTNMLTLHSGETFKVTGSGAQPGIREKKLDTFHFHDDTAEGGDRYRVVHKSGLVEVLTKQGGSTPVYMPTEVRSPAGHTVSLGYSSNPVRLETLSYRDADSQVQELLKLTYSTGGVTIDLHPGAAPDKLYHARYTLQMLNRELNKIILPSEEGANWRIEYGTVRNLLCVRKVWTPAGAEEHVAYEDEGHVLPTNGQRPALPRVTTHTVYPGAGQPPLKTTYTYKHFDTDTQQWLDRNFVGYNSGITWQDNGEDNLYRAQPSYQYSVTAHFWDGDTEIRTRTQTYNRHHLLVRQALEQDGHVEETLTQYHEQPDTPFDEQPPYFQLPHVITKRWTLRSDPFKQRVEQVTTLYDDAGNLIEEVQPTGICTRYVYYHEQGETGEDGTCPPDPENFRRNLKCSTLYPVGVQGDAPVMRTRLSYKAYLPLTGITNPWLAVSEERQLQVINADDANESEQLLQRVERAYLETPEDAYLHGRPDHQATTRYGNDLANPLRKAIESRTTRTRWRYRKVRDDKWGLEHWRDTTVSGFDLEQMSTSEAASALDGQQTYRQDGTGNAVRITYDVLGRVTEETAAPGTPDETRTVHGYTLVAATGERATQWVTESNGVMSIMTLDGCNRPVQEERETAALAGRAQARSKRLVSESRYDGLGQLRGLTFYDYYQTSTQAAEKVIELTSSFDYDAWGELCKTTQADGVTLHRERTPFGADGDQITEWMETPDRPGERQQHTVTETNNFGKPDRRFRVGSDGQILGRTVLGYDGLGHCTDEARYIEKPNSTSPTSRRTSRYQFDPQGRISQTEQPDKSTVRRDFALHSGGELTERLQIRPRNSSNDQVVCDRDFDGVSRLKSLKMGARLETYTYVENTLLPHTRTTASNRTFTYAYQASLSAQPKSISIATSVNADAPHQATFDYHPLTAAINDATNAQGTRSYLYTDQGYLEQAAWDDSITGEHYSCDYSHSLQGLPLSYTTSDGESVSHTYDTLGRLETTRQGDLLAIFSYDSAGRLHSTQTEDAANQQQVVCKQYYDDLGRQTSRTQTLTRTDGTTLTHALELAWRSDDQLYSRTLSRDGSEVLHESFDYDVLDRLEHHRFEGSELPHNAQGRPIVSQFFIYDELNNLTECFTDFADGKIDVANYTYDGFLLREATHSLQPDYPARQAFSHDDDGNLLNDEQGNRLHYDPAGRLVEVRSADDSQLLHSYRYDGHGDLVGSRQGNAGEVQRRYQGYRLSSTLENGLLTQYLYAADQPAGLQQSGTASGTRLLLTDHVGSVIGESTGSALEQASYNAYGETLAQSNLQGLLGFNGEARERALGWYLLGRGYRAYNPVLMRFHSPDELYPEAAGINPYSYCGGNPVNWRDPSGHVGERYSMELPYIPPIPAPKPKSDWRSWLGVALGAVFVVVSMMFMPPLGFTLAFAAGATSLGLDIASTAASAVAAANGDETANNWAFWLGIASAVSTLGIMAMSRFMRAKTAISDVATRSVATQTDDVIGAVSKGGDLTQPPSIFGRTSNLPSRRFNNYVRKFTTGNGNTKFSELDSLDSIPLRGDGEIIRNPLFKPDKNAPAVIFNNDTVITETSRVTVTPPSPSAEFTPAAGIAGWGRKIVNGKVSYTPHVSHPDFRPPGIA